jgi:hypothetical protein
MKRILAAALATACVVASTPGFARGGHAGTTTGFGRGFGGDPTTRLAPPPPQAPAGNSIPAPLASPSAAPTINGPGLRSPYGGVMR